MTSFEFDTVKAEKADAMRRFNRKRNCVYFLQITGALVLLWCFFKWYPVITDMASGHISFLNQLYVFVLINVIAFFVYHFSTITTTTTTTTNNNTNTDSKNDSPFHSDLYEEYISLSTYSPPRKTTNGEDNRLIVSQQPVVSLQKDTHQDKQGVVCENSTDGDSPAGEKEKLVRDDLIVAVKNDKCYRRTRSERRGGGEEKSSQQRELRRSETEIGRGLFVSSGRYNSPARKSMHEMNNEEFRLTIERFIASTKKSLREENIAFLTEEREDYMAITYTAI